MRIRKMTLSHLPTLKQGTPKATKLISLASLSIAINKLKGTQEYISITGYCGATRNLSLTNVQLVITFFYLDSSRNFFFYQTPNSSLNIAVLYYFFSNQKNTNTESKSPYYNPNYFIIGQKQLNFAG